MEVYEEERYCSFCDKYTKHRCRDENNEITEFEECLECKSESIGHTGTLPFNCRMQTLKVLKGNELSVVGRYVVMSKPGEVLLIDIFREHGFLVFKDFNRNTIKAKDTLFSFYGPIPE